MWYKLPQSSVVIFFGVESVIFQLSPAVVTDVAERLAGGRGDWLAGRAGRRQWDDGEGNVLTARDAGHPRWNDHTQRTAPRERRRRATTKSATRDACNRRLRNDFRLTEHTSFIFNVADFVRPVSWLQQRRRRTVLLNSRSKPV